MQRKTRADEERNKRYIKTKQKHKRNKQKYNKLLEMKITMSEIKIFK